MSIAQTLLLLFAIFLGTAFGAGIYEARIVLPLWFKKVNGIYKVDENIRTIDTGRRFWAMITTVPLTLLTIINMIFAVRSVGVLHHWWVAACIIVLLERISTFTFFIPGILKLQRSQNLPEAKVSVMISRWVVLNSVRNLLTLIAWLFVLKALML